MVKRLKCTTFSVGSIYGNAAETAYSEQCIFVIVTKINAFVYFCTFSLQPFSQTVTQRHWGTRDLWSGPHLGSKIAFAPNSQSKQHQVWEKKCMKMPLKAQCKNSLFNSKG